MKGHTYPQEITPGRQIFQLTREEVCRAAFIFVLNRQPTDSEAKRLSLIVHDGLGGDSPWELWLTLKDER